MKHFQKIIIYLVILTINSGFIQTDLLSQNDCLEKQDTLIIGGVYKVTLISDEEVLGKIQGSDSASIKLISHEEIVNINKDQIKSIEKLKYLLQFDTDKEVTVTTNSGILYKGDLLSVTDYNLSLTKNDELYNQSSIRLKNNVLEIERGDIKSVLIHGEDNALTGLGYGALIGAGIGAIIGYSAYKKGPNEIMWGVHAGQNALIGGLIGSLVGSFGGLIVGISSSTPDKTIVIKSDDDLYRLNKISKYSFGELPIHKNQKKKNNK